MGRTGRGADDCPVAADAGRQGPHPHALHPGRAGPAGALRGRRADVLRGPSPGCAGQDDPVRGPAAWHQRTLEQRASHAERAEVD